MASGTKSVPTIGFAGADNGIYKQNKNQLKQFEKQEIFQQWQVQATKIIKKVSNKC